MSDEISSDKLLDVNGIAEWFSARGFHMTRSGVYRLVGDRWPIVKVRGKLTARPCSLERHLDVLEAKAEVEARKPPPRTKRLRTVRTA